MKRHATTITLVVLITLLLLLPTACKGPRSRLTLGGGPTGGTFHNFATSLAQIVNEGMPGTRVTAEHSGGSVDNLASVEEGKFAMGIVFAADAYLGSRGELKEGMAPTRNVRAMARLYGATAHLVVRQSSSIRSPFDLKKNRIAIGNPGSGSALAARRYFESLGIWQEIVPLHVGFDMGLDELRRGNVEAVWLLVGSPNLSVRKLAQQTAIRLIDLLDAPTAQNLFATYPCYTATRIPAGSYPDQIQAVTTFEDPALLVVNAQLDTEVVNTTLKLLFSKKGLDLMIAADPAARDLSRGKGLTGVTIPLHPGAELFWREGGKIRAP